MLTNKDLAILDAIRQSGYLLVTLTAGQPVYQTADGREVPAFRIRRLLDNEAIVAVDGGLFGTDPQSYVVKE